MSALSNLLLYARARPAYLAPQASVDYPKFLKLLSLNWIGSNFSGNMTKTRLRSIHCGCSCMLDMTYIRLIATAIC